MHTVEPDSTREATERLAKIVNSAYVKDGNYRVITLFHHGNGNLPLY